MIDRARAATVRAAEGAEACAFFNVRRLSRLLERQFSRALAPAGVTASQFAILVAALMSRDVSVTARGRTIGMSQSALSRQLAAMVRRGWVELVTEHGRAQRVLLAAPGLAIVNRALPLWREAQEEVVASLGVHPWTTLLQGIRKLSAQTRQHGRADVGRARVRPQSRSSRSRSSRSPSSRSRP
ncbi:MAG: MarR family winged helix-turn-helix transcriptional regulator [Vicinamibacterales bacterium]